MDVTDEMRQAVYEADCQRLGHIYKFDAVFRGAETDEKRYVDLVAGPDDETLPHLSCQRCTKVWLVIDDPGFGYDDAIAKLRKRGAPAQIARPQRVEGGARRVEAPEA